MRCFIRRSRAERLKSLLDNGALEKQADVSDARRIRHNLTAKGLDRYSITHYPYHGRSRALGPSFFFDLGGLGYTKSPPTHGAIANFRKTARKIDAK